jgi:hypothetical protein
VRNLFFIVGTKHPLSLLSFEVKAKALVLFFLASNRYEVFQCDDFQWMNLRTGKGKKTNNKHQKKKKKMSEQAAPK